jgi:predicted RNase H-like nuclease (RuvC/YqgF family)
VSTLETKVKSQDEEINKLKESNGELNDSNRMMSSKIDTLEKEHLLNNIQIHDIENSSSF